MNIIVEGLDGSGKSTFIDILSEIMKREQIRGSSFEISELGADGMFEYSKKLITENDKIIVNRFFYSNLVYGRIYNKYPMMSKPQYDELQELVNKNSIVYYLYAGRDIIEDRIGVRGDDMVDIEDLWKIENEYLKMWDEYMPKNFIAIDTSAGILDRNLDIYNSVIENVSALESIN